MFYMGTEIMIDMYKNKSNNNYDYMNSTTNRTCKGKCVNYKATKPTNRGGRYAVGQVRCQTCDIYLIPQGVKDKRYCKCCNYRVRTKPRNSLYKEKYHNKINELQKSTIKQVSTNKDLELDKILKKHIEQNFEDSKKHTPIYEEIDDSVKTYYEFKEFLDYTMKLQSNYQLVMLKELLEYGPLHKGEISESLAYFNNKDSSDINVVKLFFNVSVYKILLKYEIVTMKDTKTYPHIPLFSLNVKFTNNEKLWMIEDIVKRLIKYNQEQNIPDNEFPNADNMGNISWDTSKKNLVINYKPNNSEAES